MRLAAFASIAFVLALPAAAEVVVYRCTAADGSVTLQNDRRCAKGQREERRVLETPTSRAVPAMPAPVATPAPIAPMAGAPASNAVAPTGATTNSDASAADANGAPPAGATPVIERGTAAAPPVFACRTWDGQRYYGDDERPAPRCAPLTTVGLDGRSPTEAQACELRADSCEPVLESARCDAWAERLRLAESTERFGDDDAAAAARTEAARLRTILAGTVCAR